MKSFNVLLTEKLPGTCLTLAFVLVSALPAMSQLDSTKHSGYMPDKALELLRENYLLIRLPGDRKKIEAIEQMMDGKDLSQSELKRLTKLQKEAVEERKLTNQWYREAFKDKYKFSKFAFFEDHETPKLETKTVPLFDAENKKISSSEILDRPYLVLSFQNSPINGSASVAILDQDLKPILPPFPTYTGISKSFFIFSTFSKNRYTDRTVMRLEKRLRKAAERF